MLKVNDYIARIRFAVSDSGKAFSFSECAY
jgi:hypothetical protein